MFIFYLSDEEIHNYFAYKRPLTSDTLNRTSPMFSLCVFVGLFIFYR